MLAGAFKAHARTSTAAGGRSLVCWRSSRIRPEPARSPRWSWSSPRRGSWSSAGARCWRGSTIRSVSVCRKAGLRRARRMQARAKTGLASRSAESSAPKNRASLPQGELVARATDKLRANRRRADSAAHAASRRCDIACLERRTVARFADGQQERALSASDRMASVIDGQGRRESRDDASGTGVDGTSRANGTGRAGWLVQSGFDGRFGGNGFGRAVVRETASVNVAHACIESSRRVRDARAVRGACSGSWCDACCRDGQSRCRCFVARGVERQSGRASAHARADHAASGHGEFARAGSSPGATASACRRHRARFHIDGAVGARFLARTPRRRRHRPRLSRCKRRCVRSKKTPRFGPRSPG